MAIRSKFLADRAISNEEYEKRSRINDTLVGHMADALQAPVSASLRQDLQQALSDDWLVPAHMLLVDLVGGQDSRPTLEEVRHGLRELQAEKLVQPGAEGAAAPSGLEESTREVAMDAATHLLAKWHAHVRELVSAKDSTKVIPLDVKLAPKETASWQALVSAERLARWGLATHDLDGVFMRFTNLLKSQLRLTGRPMALGGQLHLGVLRIEQREQLVLAENLQAIARMQEVVNQLVREKQPDVKKSLYKVQRDKERQRRGNANRERKRLLDIVIKPLGGAQAAGQLEALLSGPHPSSLSALRLPVSAH